MKWGLRCIHTKSLLYLPQWSLDNYLTLTQRTAFFYKVTTYNEMDSQKQSAAIIEIYILVWTQAKLPGRFGFNCINQRQFEASSWFLLSLR